MSADLAAAGEASRERLAELILDRVREAQQAERRRAAREIHDRLGYWLSLAHVELDLLDLDQHRDPRRAGAHLNAIRQAIAEGLAEIRRMVVELGSVSTIESLEKALRIVADATAPAAVMVQIMVDGDERRLPDNTRGELFLVLREAMRNAFAHAEPATVTVLVHISARRLRATVVDDGRGFDPGSVPAGCGITSMRERAGLLGGSMAIASGAERGCSVEIVVPLRG